MRLRCMTWSVASSFCSGSWTDCKVNIDYEFDEVRYYHSSLLNESNDSFYQLAREIGPRNPRKIKFGRRRCCRGPRGPLDF